MGEAWNVDNVGMRVEEKGKKKKKEIEIYIYKDWLEGVKVIINQERPMNAYAQK